MASADVQQPTEFAVPQAKASTNGPNLTNSAIFSAGLTSPIFSKTAAAAQSSDPKEHLKFSGFYGGRASGSFPVGLSTSGLFNLASSRDALGLGSIGLTGSGASFPTGIPMSLSGIFPFPPIPSMPLHASGDGIAASPSSASGSATDVTSKPPIDQNHAEQAHTQTWKHVSTESTTTQTAHFNAFTPFFRPLKSTCVAAEQPMAFWKTGTNELLCFNESFLSLIEVDPNQLQGGFRWTDLRVVDRESREVRLTDEAPNALKVIFEFGQQALTGTSRFAQVNFSFFCGSNKLKHIALTLVAMPVKEEVLWLIQELGVEKTSAAAPRPPAGQSPDVRRAGKPPAETSSAPNTPSHGRLNVPAAPATDPMERKLVKVPIRKKKPWDQNLVKFSLKKARKRSKRSAAARAAALAAAVEEQHSHDSHEGEGLSPELPGVASASQSPAPVRASPRLQHNQPQHS